MKNKFNILEIDYILEHGTLFDDGVFSYECYSENGKSYYEQLFDRSRNMGGKPFSGLLYELYPSGKLWGYRYYKDGFEYGDNAVFYENGQVLAYSCFEKDMSAPDIYEWYENGQLKTVYERHRKDEPSFFRKTEYNENGKKTVRSISCEVKFSYSYKNQADDLSSEVLWHSNGEFKKIIWKEPTVEMLYRSAEFDENGYPVDLEINSSYNPKYLSAVNNKRYQSVRRFDDSFSFSGDTLLRDYGGNLPMPYTGRICFLYPTGEIHKICEYKDGKPFSAQLVYYESGQIAEKYNIEKGRLYNRYYKWYENGVLKEVVGYDSDGHQKYIVQFFDSGIVESSES